MNSKTVAELMADGVLEDRYLVVKRADLNKEQAADLDTLLRVRNIPCRAAVVIEEDWPQFPVVVKMLVGGGKS
ncbi:hypothetical protein ACM75Z_30345 [Pseudomonas aeruginosa]